MKVIFIIFSLIYYTILPFQVLAKTGDRLNCYLIDGRESIFVNSDKFEFLESTASKMILITIISDDKIKLKTDYGEDELDIKLKFQNEKKDKKQEVYRAIKMPYKPGWINSRTLHFDELIIYNRKNASFKMLHYNHESILSISVYKCKLFL